MSKAAAQERLSVYLDSLNPGNSELLEKIEREALEANVPVIRREVQSLIKTLLAIKRPGRILEVGTAVGFSALLMCEYGPEKVHVTTIEKYEKRIPVAKENFRRAGRESQITLLEGDASDWLKELSGSFDFVFMDAAKGQYPVFLPDILRLLPPGGILLSDNILQEGELLESRFAVERRNRTIHSRMRQYLYEITHHARLETSVLSAGDGVALSVKLSKEHL